jgi:hypothetical protein
LPQGLRDASDTGAGIVARGSRLPLDLDPSGRDQIIRLFLWWHDTADGRVDVDLSAVGVSKTFGSTETCNFQKLRGSGLVHSGDLTSAPNGAAEFVDIDLNNLHKDTRYVVLTANVFSGPNFDQIPDCFVGWMERTKAQAGPIHDIRTVSNKIAVTARSKAFLGVVFDCVDRTLTWLDVPLDTNSGHSFYDAPSAACEVVREFKLYAAARVSVGELIDLHIEARGGNKLMEPTGAQTYFAVNPVVPAAGQTVVAATRPDQVMALLPSRRGASPAPAVEADPVSPQNLPSPSSDGLGVSLKDSVAEEVAVKTATEAARPGRKPR